MKAAALTRTDTHTKTHAHTSSGASIACVLLLCCSSVAALLQLCCSSCSQQWREHRLRATSLLQLCCSSGAALLQQLQSAVARASPACYCSVAALLLLCCSSVAAVAVSSGASIAYVLLLCCSYELCLLYQYKSTNTDALLYRAYAHASMRPRSQAPHKSPCSPLPPPFYARSHQYTQVRTLLALPVQKYKH
jgi:hypothetical protein